MPNQQIFFRAARIAAAVLALGAAVSTWAAEPATGRAELQAFEARIKSLYPQQRFDSIRPSPLPGFYEVTMGKSLAYVEESGRFFLFGGLWDMKDKRDLSSERRAELDKVDTRQLPAELGMAFGTGPRVLHVFADPNCGYCRMLEQTVSTLSDLKVVVYPVPILGEQSVDMVRRIWCAPNRAAAWHDWMLKNVRPAAAPANCEAPIDQLLQLATRAGVQSTPTLVAADGRRAAGALQLDELQAFIGAAAKSARVGATPKTQNVPTAAVRPTGAAEWGGSARVAAN